jgi:hypothetical protein
MPRMIAEVYQAFSVGRLRRPDGRSLRAAGQDDGEVEPGQPAFCPDVVAGRDRRRLVEAGDRDVDVVVAVLVVRWKLIQATTSAPKTRRHIRQWQ